MVFDSSSFHFAVIIVSCASTMSINYVSNLGGIPLYIRAPAHLLLFHSITAYTGITQYTLTSLPPPVLAFMSTCP